MDIKKQVFKLLRESNINDINIPSFSRKYIEKLLTDLYTYVDNIDFMGKINIMDISNVKLDAYQEITGPMCALSGISGEIKPLISFANRYSNLSIDGEGMLLTESLLDFLNLNNGLFVVQLSINREAELSLNPPKSGKSNEEAILSNYSSLLEIPISFSFGKIIFYISNKY